MATINTEHGEMIKTAEGYEYRACNIVKVNSRWGGHKDFTPNQSHWKISRQSEHVKVYFNDSYPAASTLKEACDTIDRAFRSHEKNVARCLEMKRLRPIHNLINDAENDLDLPAEYVTRHMRHVYTKANVLEFLALEKYASLKDRLDEVLAELEKWQGLSTKYTG